MTKAASIKQARSESSIYPQGNSWVLSTWDPKVSAKRLLEGLSYGRARQARADWIKGRAAELRILARAAEREARRMEPGAVEALRCLGA